MPKTKQIMTALKIDWLSAVDNPAQEGALAALLKRHDPDDREPLPTPEKGETQAEFLKRYDRDVQERIPNKKKRDAVAKSIFVSVAKAAVLLSNEDAGHGHGVHSHVIVTDYGQGVMRHGETSWVEGHSHPWIRDGKEIVVGAAHGHTHGVARVSKTNKSGEEPSKDEPMTDAEKAAQTALEARAKRAETILTLDAHVRKHFDNLAEDKQDEFLAKSADERKAIAKNAADSNPVVFKSASGLEYRKNDDQRLIEMAKSNDRTSAELAKSQATAETLRLEKRAEEEFPHMPGDVATRAAIIKATESIEDKDVRKAAFESLKAQDAGLAAAFKSHGSRAPAEVTDAEDQLDAMAKAHAKEHNVSEPDAYVTVIATDEGRALYAKSQEKASA